MKLTRCAYTFLISAMVLCATPFASANIRIGSAADWGTNSAWGQNISGFENVKGWRNAIFMEEFADHPRKNYQPLSWHNEKEHAARANSYLSLMKMAIVENPVACMLKQACVEGSYLVKVNRTLSNHGLFVRIAPNLASKNLGLKSLLSAQMLNLLSIRWSESSDVSASANPASGKNEVDASKAGKTPSSSDGVLYSLPSYEDYALLSESSSYISRYDELLMNPAYANRCWSPCRPSAFEQFRAWQSRFNDPLENGVVIKQYAGALEVSYAGKYGNLFEDNETTASKESDSATITWQDAMSVSSQSWTNWEGTNLGTDWTNPSIQDNPFAGKIQVIPIYIGNVSPQTTGVNLDIWSSNNSLNTPVEKGDSTPNDSAGDEESNSAQSTPATLFRDLVVGVWGQVDPWFGLFHRMAAQFSKYPGLF
jgi:hypothetical protein